MPQVAGMPSRGLYGKGHAPAGLSPGFTGRLPLRTWGWWAHGDRLYTPPWSWGSGYRFTNVRHRGRQHPAVRRFTRPESRGVPGEVPTGGGPGHQSAVRAVRLGTVCVATPPLLHCGGRVERQPLQQCLLALSLREGGPERLWEGLCAQALRVRVIRVLSAALGGRLREEEELVQVPVALPNFRTMDHLFHVTAEISRSPQAYHFYIDFNKAINSVPHPTLRRVLHHYQMPAGLVDLISGLYAHPQDAPLVNNVTPYHYLQTRGLRQGCPMSLVLFILYSNVLLHAAPQPSPLERPAETSAHAFIDDKLYRSPSQTYIQKLIDFYDTDARTWGLQMNCDKSEVHALGGVPQHDFQSPSGFTLSTVDPDTKQPRKGYKYLGVYIYNDKHPPQLRHQIHSELNSYFVHLSPLRLSLPELVKLVNVQLIPILTYRLIAHPFLPSEIDELRAAVWKELATHGRISPKVPTKDIYQPRAKLGLGSRHLGIAVHKSFVEAGLRYLNQDGPPASCVAVRDALLSTRQNALQDSFLDAAYRLSLRFHAPGPWNPCLPCELHERERLYAAPRNAPPCLATVTKVHKKTATICFDTGKSATITERSNFTFTFPNTPPLPPGDITHYHLLSPFSSPQTRNPDIPVPLQADLMDSTCEGHWFHLPNLRHVLNHEDLLGWGCIQVANLVAELPFDDTAWIYTDGISGDGGHGSAFAIFWQQQCYVLCCSSPSPTSGGSEQWAMAMALAHLPNILPNTPVVILGDNLDTVEAVNRALSSPSPARPSTYTQGTRDAAYTSLLAPLPHLIHVAWIKGHAHFMGNELADYFSKWAAQALLSHPSLLPPPPLRVGSETPHPLPLPDPPTHAPTFRHQRKLSPTEQLFLGNRIQVGVRHVWLSGLQTSL